MNKRGQVTTILYVVGGLLGVVLLAYFLMLGWGTVKLASDELIPALNSFGEITDGVNLSNYTETVLTPVDSVIGNFGLMIGLIFILGIVGILSMAFMFRNSYNVWTISLFVVSIGLLIILSIFISNSYEDFYLEQGEFGDNFRDASLASYLIIQSPVIMTIVAFIAGIILFTGNREDQFNA